MDRGVVDFRVSELKHGRDRCAARLYDKRYNVAS